MSRGCFFKFCRDYSTKFNGRLPTFQMNFVRTHHVRQKHMISSRIFFFPESCVRQFAGTSGKKLLPRGPVAILSNPSK
jgi:hypothetical protein